MAAFFMPAYLPGALQTHQTNGWCVKLVDPPGRTGFRRAVRIGWFASKADRAPPNQQRRKAVQAKNKFDNLMKRGLLDRNSRGQFFKGKMKEVIEELDLVATREDSGDFVFYTFPDLTSICLDKNRITGRVQMVVVFGEFGQEVAEA